MPTYEYRCSEGHELEVQRKVDDRNRPLKCPLCGLDARLVPSGGICVPWFPDSTRTYREPQRKGDPKT